MNNASSFIQTISSSFWTCDEFKKQLTEFLQNTLLVKIKYTIRIRNVEIHIEAEGNGVNSNTTRTNRNEWTHSSDIQVVCEITANNRISESVIENAKQIVFSFLGNEKYLDSTALPYYENGVTVKAMCEATLNRILTGNEAVAVIMIDIDNFKNINDEFDHSVGDAIILEFSDLLVKEAGERGIIIHRSGDEFYLIVPYHDLNEVLDLSYHLRQTVRNHKYSAVDETELQITMAQGICLISKKDELSFEQAVKYAENAYIINGIKHHDSVRVYNAAPPGKVEQGVTDLDRAYVYICSNPIKEKPLLNPYLDYISWKVSRTNDLEKLQDEIDKIIKWINPNNSTFVGFQMLVENRKMSFACQWSIEELAFSIYYGLLRNSLVFTREGQKLYLSMSNENFSICIEGDLLYKTKGYLMQSIATFETVIRGLKEVPVYLVQIGYNPPPLPEECFNHIIRIDARPTIGGNLPAFWAAALAELIELNANSPGKVLVYGNVAYGTELWTVLSNFSLWGEKEYSFSFLEKKTMQSVEKIMHCKKCLENNIHMISENEISELVTYMKSVLQGPLITIPPLYTRDTLTTPILKRTLAYNEIILGIGDGCRVNTMGEAFPIVLEILRTCEAQPIRGEMVDQAKRKLKELTNFKIVIQDISRDRIPAYYQSEEDAFDMYYDSLFKNSDSFFQKYLTKRNQYKTVINHVADLLQSSGLAYATRRAVLIVPNEIEEDEVSPLGLVSIFISPREYDGIVYFDFSFTWRTVEAVTGLPYSLYGSAKYASQIFDDIMEVARKECDLLPQLKIGTLSYTAYSLHMFLDDYYSKIVRGIINEASV